MILYSLTVKNMCVMKCFSRDDGLSVFSAFYLTVGYLHVKINCLVMDLSVWGVNLQPEL